MIKKFSYLVLIYSTLNSTNYKLNLIGAFLEFENEIILDLLKIIEMLQP